LAVQHPALALLEDARDQRQIMAHLGAPVRGRPASQAGKPVGGPLQRRSGGISGSDQLAIEPAPVVFGAAVLDVGGARLAMRRRSCQPIADAPGNSAAWRSSHPHRI
jgi:hypothetical protein